MGTQTRQINGRRFTRVAPIEPECEVDGTPRKFMPQSRYAKADTTPLNRHGAGPFCRFKLKSLCQTAGVYVLTIDDEVKYVGRARNFAERWGSRGYGTISPRNCYQDGQPTNCKINNRILRTKLEGARIDLWFHPTEQIERTEVELISALSPAWNGNVPGAS